MTRISYEWLGEYLDTGGISPQEAAHLLTMTGTKIESVQVIDLSAILVGRVVEQKVHPTSNKPLWIHQVDVGGGKIIQIIAGAPNAVKGTIVPVALPGTRVPSGTLVRDGKIAGEVAQGMLCSADELLLGEEREPRIMLLDRGEPGESPPTVPTALGISASHASSPPPRAAISKPTSCRRTSKAWRPLRRS